MLQMQTFSEEWRLLGCYAVWLLLRTDISEELSASIRVIRIGELGTPIALPSNSRKLRKNTIGASVASYS
jgi:hypothetical protein